MTAQNIPSPTIPPVSPAPVQTPLPDALISMGGYRWLPEYVFWGSPGPGNAGKMLGYDPIHGAVARPSRKEIERKTIDFWMIEAVYTLFDRNTPIYVGEGILGYRIKSHYSDVEKVGRWDSFSWLSPCKISDDRKSPPTITTPVKTIAFSGTGKRVVELFEMAIITLSLPAGNRQIPDDGGRIHWITQVKHPKAEGTVSDKLDLLLKHSNKK